MCRGSSTFSIPGMLCSPKYSLVEKGEEEGGEGEEEGGEGKEREGRGRRREGRRREEGEEGEEGRGGERGRRGGEGEEERGEEGEEGRGGERGGGDGIHVHHIHLNVPHVNVIVNHSLFLPSSSLTWRHPPVPHATAHARVWPHQSAPRTP